MLCFATLRCQQQIEWFMTRTTSNCLSKFEFKRSSSQLAPQSVFITRQSSWRGQLKTWRHNEKPLKSNVRVVESLVMDDRNLENAYLLSSNDVSHLLLLVAQRSKAQHLLS